MDRIKVELLQATDINILFKAISKPYRKDFLSMDKDKALDKLRNITLTKKHSSVLEHAVFTFDISGISRLCMQELARHRMASYTVESTRYTLPSREEVQNNRYIELCGIAIKNKEHIDFKKAMDILKKYIVVPEPLKPDLERSDIKEWKLSWSLYELFEYIKFYGDTDSRDIIKYVLPESWRTNLTMTINLRSLINFLTLRLDKTAHFEIRHLAGLIYKALPQDYKDFLSSTISVGE